LAKVFAASGFYSYGFGAYFSSGLDYCGSGAISTGFLSTFGSFLGSSFGNGFCSGVG
jgi:hypothetical protein